MHRRLRNGVSPIFAGRFLARLKKTLFFALLSVSVALTGCATQKTTARGAVGVDRSQLMLVSEQQLERDAAKSYQQVLAEAKKAGKLDTDPKLLARVRRIVQRMIPQTAVFRPNAPKWHWEVHVIDSDELNAWCMPGGKIVVYSGLVKKLKLTDDELAAVLGHEISHALREHARERMSQAMLANLALNIGAIALGAGQTEQQLAAMAYNITVGLPFSRLHEEEADRMGVELAARAGYNPYAAVNVWKKMKKLGSGAPPELLSTHPSYDTRIHILEKTAKRVWPLYEKARRAGAHRISHTTLMRKRV